MPAAESLLFESDHTAPQILRAPYSATQCFEQTSLRRSHCKTGHICERSVHDKVRKLLDLCHVSQVQTIKRSTASRVTYDKFTQLAEPPEPRRLLDKLPRVPR